MVDKHMNKFSEKSEVEGGSGWSDMESPNLQQLTFFSVMKIFKNN